MAMSYRKKDYADIEKWRNTVTTYNRKYYQATSNARNSYKKWTQEEDRIVLEHTIPDREISKLLGRSMKAIAQRRHNLIRKQHVL